MAGRPRTVLVTGAGGTLGRGIAVRLAAEGHRLGLTDLRPAELDRTAALVEASSGPVARPADLTAPTEVEAVVAAVERALGPVDVLITAAGIYGERVPFLASDPELWWRVSEVNVRAAALCLRRVLPAMVERGSGHVVNLNSRAATWDDPGHSSTAYSASKAALARLTSAVAAELDGTGVVVVDFSPGLARTGMTEERPDIDLLPPGAFTPVEAATAKVSDLISGRYDALHGHFVHVRDDLDALVAALRKDPTARRLSLAPVAEDDPVA